MHLVYAYLAKAFDPNCLRPELKLEKKTKGSSVYEYEQNSRMLFFLLS